MNIRRSTAITAALVLATLTSRADAAFIITINQVGSNVVATGRGTIDITDFTLGASGQYPAFIEPWYPQFALGTFTDAVYFLFSGYVGPAFNTVGPGGITYASSSSGDYVGVGLGELLLPSGYVSGTPLSNTTMWDNATFASLGLTPGSYIWSFGSGPDSDSITMIIGSSVPEPTTLVMSAIAVACGLIGR